MKKAELITIVAKELGQKKYDVEIIVESLINMIICKVAKGEKVRITGFGSFERRARSARTIKNPQTQEEIKIPASKIPHFSASSAFKSKVNN